MSVPSCTEAAASVGGTPTETQGVSVIPSENNQEALSNRSPSENNQVDLSNRSPSENNQEDLSNRVTSTLQNNADFGSLSLWSLVDLLSPEQAERANEAGAAQTGNRISLFSDDSSAQAKPISITVQVNSEQEAHGIDEVVPSSESEQSKGSDCNKMPTAAEVSSSALQPRDESSQNGAVIVSVSCSPQLTQPTGSQVTSVTNDDVHSSQQAESRTVMEEVDDEVSHEHKSEEVTQNIVDIASSPSKDEQPKIVEEKGEQGMLNHMSSIFPALECINKADQNLVNSTQEEEEDVHVVLQSQIHFHQTEGQETPHAAEQAQVPLIGASRTDKDTPFNLWKVAWPSLSNYPGESIYSGHFNWLQALLRERETLGTFKKNSISIPDFEDLLVIEERVATMLQSLLGCTTSFLYTKLCLDYPRINSEKKFEELLQQSPLFIHSGGGMWIKYFCKDGKSF